MMTPDPNFHGKKEEITDIIEDLKTRYTPENFASLGIKVGKVLRFNYEGSLTAMRITKIAKGRYWAQHIELIDQKIVRSHYGHLVDTTEETVREKGAPYCQDCEVIVNEPSTEDGEVKAAYRKEHTLADGTEID